MIRHEVMPNPRKRLSVPSTLTLFRGHKDSNADLDLFAGVETLHNIRCSFRVEIRVHEELLSQDSRIEDSPKAAFEDSGIVRAHSLAVHSGMVRHDWPAIPTVRRPTELLREHEFGLVGIHGLKHAFYESDNRNHDVVASIVSSSAKFSRNCSSELSILGHHDSTLLCFGSRLCVVAAELLGTVVCEEAEL
jgi:hypothetical protein